MIFQIMADPEELFTKAQKSEIILQYGYLGSLAAQLPCRDGSGINILRSRTAGSQQSWNSRGSFKGLKTQKALKKEKLLVAKERIIWRKSRSLVSCSSTQVQSSTLPSFLRSLRSRTSCSFSFFQGMSQTVLLAIPAVQDVRILIPEPSPLGSCAAELTVLVIIFDFVPL